MPDILYDESWEFQNNTSDRMLFKSDDFDSMYTDPETQETYPAWKNDFEARFPSDEWEEITQLKTFVSWVVSTDRTQATNKELASSVTYDGTVYTKDTAEYRLAKFKAEFSDYAEVNSWIFYYVFTELFLMVDSRAKNLFLGFHGSKCEIEGMRRKAVAEPYDMDTGLGTNNEGTLTYPYYLEDTDTVDGANVFNGQTSVLWTNLRDTQRTAIVNMYQTLRSQGTLAYNNIESIFETHQNAWPESVWNEDAEVKYIEPLVNPEGGKEPTDFYLPMAQGDKKQQRKWWLKNRFAYMDSKWNAGDALSQVIQLRGYAKSDITVTPYINLYPTVKYGSYLVQARSSANVSTTLKCPLDSVNDTEIYIYSAPHIASAGDLSGLKVGVADFSQAVNIQEVKVGDSSTKYDNPNMKRLSFGSNILLKKVDARNCSGLGTDEQKTVDMSNCSIIEEIYFDGTSVQGVTLPNGGVLRVLHLPSTITNLTILNQKNITDLTVASYSNISTLRIENSSVNSKKILNSTPTASRVRLIGIAWEATNAAEIEALLDKLDTMRGLDESGGNVDKAQISGTIHTESLTGAQIASYKERYPYLNVIADHTTSYLTYKTWDGSSTISTVECYDGVPQSASPSIPVRTATMQYNYTAVGWNRNTDAQTDDPSAITNVTEDRTVYAAYSRTVRSHTITFVRGSADGGGTLQSSDYPYGSTPVYSGATPTTTQGDAEDYPFEGWSPTISTVTGPTTYTAVFGSPIEDVEITDSWDTIIANIDNGTYKTAYKIGNYKPLDLGTEGTVNMQIVAMDEDDLASGGKAPLTFIAKKLLTTTHNMNSANTTKGGYEASDMRTYLNGTILPLIPSNVAARLQRVNKIQSTYTNGVVVNGQTTVEKIWIPSHHEIFSTLSTYESQGATYSKIYKDATSRIKNNISSGSATHWWLRSASYASTFRYVGDNGNGKYTNAYNTGGVALGFCLGFESETITDSWSEIFAAEQDGTYSTKYSIGDTKMLDLGTEGQHLMEIVAFDTDDKADGTGKAKITWCTKYLSNKVVKFNNTAKTVDGETSNVAGGWLHSDLREHIRGLKAYMPNELQENIKEVTKISSAYINGTYVKDGQTTIDDLFAPSATEAYSAYDGESGSATKYAGYTPTTRKKRRYPSDTPRVWCLRSVYNGTSVRCVSGEGYVTTASPTQWIFYIFGFCT